jgi:uncharacterized protein (DUF1800 family)
MFRHRNFPQSYFMRRSVRFLSLFTACCALLSPAWAALDVSPADGLPDIWAIINNVGSLSPTADDDGDGQTNAAEAIAGTNPKSASDSIKIKSITRSGGNVVIVFPAVGGKRYDVQSSSTPSAGGFAAVSPASTHLPTADGDISATVPGGSGPKFYRVVVSDLDSDSDGLTNYEERMLGLNANLADSNNDGTSDFSYVSTQLALPDTVTIRAVASFASEDGPASGTFEITRSRSLFNATIPYSVSGTATPATDYLALPGSVTLPQGVTSATVSVDPNTEAQNVVESGESVTVTLAPPPPGPALYTLGNPSIATVIIGETTAAKGTGLMARYYDTSSTTYSRPENFGSVSTYTYTRTNTTNGVATIAYSGTPALTIGNQVNVAFTAGNLNNAAYSPKLYTVTGATPTNFTVAITGTSLPTNQTTAAACVISITSFPHPGVINRVDPTVDFVWLYGTPNGVAITPNSPPDNYSATWDAYLQPTTAGSYIFQLDADDKARVLLDTGGGLVQILEHGWDGPATVGTFKQSAPVVLAVPASPAQRYHIRVEHVETTGDARCRLQWNVNGGTFANIPQANQFTHTQGATYTFARTNATSGTATITLTGHGLVDGDTATVAFSSGNLFTPNVSDPAGYSGLFTVANATANTFTVPIVGTNLPANVTTATACFLENRPASTTTGLFNRCYTNTTFTGAPGRVGVDVAVTTGNNGIWGTGTPDVTLVQPDTFSVRWTGQIQPQYSEDYTIIVQADDGCSLWINGQPQVLKTALSTNQSGSTYSYDPGTGDAVITYSALVVPANNFVVGETVRLDPTSGNLTHATGSTYNYNGTTGDAVIDYSNLANVTPGGFVVGETIELDPTSGSLTTLGTLPYVITAATSSTFTVNFGTGVFVAGNGTINVADTRNGVVTAATASTFTVNFGVGKYAAGSTGNVSLEIVNKQLKEWSSMSGERYIRLPMIGGVRYDIQLDYYENTSSARCQLFWYSPSQPRQIIPSNRLYPTSTPSSPLAPPILVSPTSAVALVGGPFSYTVAGSNGANVTVIGNPDWLTFSGGVLSGTPPSGAAGHYQIVVTTTDAEGTGTSVIELDVQDTGGTIAREYWNGVTGTSVASIPTGTAPSGTGNLSQLAAVTDYGDDYGARIRGYITAPETGNYYFWLAASNSAELWISNDDEPITAVKRAWVKTGTAALEWNNAGETKQKSPWLALEAGHKYYIEILHKAGTGVGDNLAVGWLKPSQTGTAPSEVVPGYVLSTYVVPPAASAPGTLYAATMLSQAGATTNGVGTSTLRLSADETTAVMKYNYANLTGPITSQHIHTDPYLAKPSTIVFDIDTPATPGDGLITSGPDAGGYKWTINAVGTLSAAEIREIIKQGKAYINLHTAAYPNGEIRGNYTLANGSRTFTPPPAPPALTDDSSTNNGASRFLTQATFGPSPADIAALKAFVPAGGKTRYELWIEDQFAKPASRQLPEVLARELSDGNGGAQFDETLTFNAWWRDSVDGADQLRQRVAYALSQIHVVSAQGPLDNRGEALSYFYDKLVDNAFANFRVLLEDTTLTPTMGRYLDMLRNDKPDISIGRSPNENYAREIKQLFSIGLFSMWPDGTLKLNSKDELIPTYTQREIVGFAHVFTGWDYGYDGAFRTTLGATTNWIRQMREVPARHFVGQKRILNNEVLPGLTTAGGQPIDAYSVHNAAQLVDSAYQTLPVKELDVSHDQLFNHPNVGPFICRQLIQRLVTSNPSRDYLYRVVQKFNDNGSGVRGDMQAVIKAILLDYEARNSTETAKPAYGKQREPVLRVAAAGRAFRRSGIAGTYSETGTHVITITAANKLAGGNIVFLEFPRPGGVFAPGDTTPSSEAYTVLSTPAPTATAFSVNAKGWIGLSGTDGTTNGGISGTYSQTAGSSSITVTLSGHWLGAGQKAYLDFGPTTTGTALADGIYASVLSTSTDTASGTTFTITAPDTTARTGRVKIVRFTGSFSVTNSGLAAPQDKRITLDTAFGGIADHHLIAGNSVYLNFTVGNPQPPDGEFVVESVPDSNTFTVLTTGIGNDSDNGMFMFPLPAQPLNRSGNVNVLASTFLMGRTDTDFDQTPLNSPTVFNFFLPDYKFPGSLASQGITTPEFQDTAETNVMREANFFERGIYASGNTTGFSSFKSGTNALIMDLSPWMANALGTVAPGLQLGAGTNTTKPWTNDENLSVLIDRLNTLLLGGQLPAAVKAEITTFVQTRANMALAYNQTTNPYTNIAYNNSGTPSDTEKRNRIRAILHFILTSPDFIIQR